MLPLLAACAPEPGPVGTTVARFDLHPGALAWGDVPYPSDLYRDDDGRIEIGALPDGIEPTPLADAFRELLSARDGFCTTCTAAFRIDGDLDAVPAEVADLTDPVVLADLETGEPVPLRVQWADGLLTVRPLPGHVLAPARRYAVAVTDALVGGDGLPVRADAAFAAVRDGAPDADPRAVAVLGEAFEVLDRERVVGLGVFTTDDPARDLFAVRDAVAARPPARATVDRVWTGAALDDLLGVPAEDRPGIDAPPAAGTAGTAAIRHATTAIVVAGRFPAARFLEGQGTDVGVTSRGADGLPEALGEDEVPFVLMVPAGADPANLPVVVAHHGFNASRTTGFVLADTAGRAGYAVLAIDAYQHGARAPSAVDDLHAMRGDVEGADGFAETSPLDVSSRVFGLFGTPPERMLSPEYPLAAFGQFAADVLSTLALVRTGDWSLVADADPLLDGLAFDPDRVAFVGNSMGAVVGTSVVTADPALPAVLDVMPGGIVDTLAASGEFSSLVDDVLLPLLGVTGPFDEVERSKALDATIDLYRWALDPVDPLAHSAHLGAGDVLVQLAGHDEVAAPGASEAVVAAAGVAPSRYDGAMHGMLEVAAQDAVWADPLVPPLVALDPPVRVENPIEAVHAEIEAFLGAP